MKKIKEQYNIIGKDYIKYQKQFFTKREDRGRKLIQKLMGDLNGEIVVDIGCGSGDDAFAYKKKGAKKVIGIDPSSLMIDEAKKRNIKGCEFFIGEYEKMPLKNNSADVLVGRFSLHYNFSLDKAYKEINRVLKPNGFCIFLIPHPLEDFISSKSKDFRKKEVVSIWLYNKKVKISYPTHSFSEYFTDEFLKLFKLENIKEFIQEEGILEKYPKMPTALLFKARKIKK